MRVFTKDSMQCPPRMLAELAQTLTLFVMLAVSAAHSTPALASGEGLTRDSNSTAPRESLSDTDAMYGASSMADYARRRTVSRATADEKFIRETLDKTKGDRNVVVMGVVQLGWQFLRKGDPISAMRRFNQAWLHDQESVHVHWGFAAAYGAMQKFDMALAMFERANLMNAEEGSLPAREVSRFYCDYGSALLVAAQQQGVDGESTKGYLSRANGLFRKSKDINIDNGCCTYAKWAQVLFLMQDYEQAWAKIHLGQSQERQCEVPGLLLLHLQREMPEPVR
ncbi:MAG: hypothetical protein WCV99_13000 [Sterolibacterium sp.]